MMNKDYMDTEWFKTLAAEVERTSKQAVANVLGYSRTTISLVMAGKYPVSTDAIGKSVNEKLGAMTCKYNGDSITPSICRSTSSAPAPTHNPSKMALWSACQNCPNNQKGGM